jgi:hypothetical protein
MPDLLFDRNQVVLVKIEVTRGTDISPVGADAIKCGTVYPTVDGQNLERIAVSNSIAALQRKFIQKVIRMSIPVEVKGSGAAGTAPKQGRLLQCCGMTETINAGVSAAYAPENDDADMKSCTIYVYKAGLCFKAVGCMGTFRWNHAPEGYSVLTFDIEGIFSDVADEPNPTPTYDSTDPIQVQSAGFSFGAWHDAVCQGFTLNANNTVGRRPDINSADGLAGMFISGRDPQWGANIEAVLEAENSFWSDFEDYDTVALDIAHGTVAGNIVEFDAPKAGYFPPQIGEQNSVNTYALSGQLLEDSSEDNFTLTYR